MTIPRQFQDMRNTPYDLTEDEKSVLAFIGRRIFTGPFVTTDNYDQFNSHMYEGALNLIKTTEAVVSPVGLKIVKRILLKMFVHAEGGSQQDLEILLQKVEDGTDEGEG